MYKNIDVNAAEIRLERNLLRNVDLISGSTDLEVNVIMELVRLCNMFSFFSIQKKIEQVSGLPKGAPLSQLLTKVFVENVETVALESYFLKHKFWGH
jgi:hypothetical protein